MVINTKIQDDLETKINHITNQAVKTIINCISINRNLTMMNFKTNILAYRNFEITVKYPYDLRPYKQVFENRLELQLRIHNVILNNVYYYNNKTMRDLVNVEVTYGY